MAKFQALKKTLQPYSEAGTQSVRDYVMSAGGKKKKGSYFSDAQSKRITELSKQLGAARRTVERWVTPKTSKEHRQVGAKYKGQLKEILPKEDRKFPAVTLRFKGTVKISEDESYRDGGKGAPGVSVEFSGAELGKLVAKVEGEPLADAYDEDGEPNNPGEYILFVYGSGGEFSQGGSNSDADPVFKIE